MVASPEPQMAVIRRSTYGTTTVGFSITIGPTIGPGLAGLSFGGFGLVSGDCLPGVAGWAAAGRAGGGSFRYLSGKSERMERLSETFAFNWNEASVGMAKTMLPVMLVNP